MTAELSGAGELREELSDQLQGGGEEGECEEVQEAVRLKKEAYKAWQQSGSPEDEIIYRAKMTYPKYNHRLKFAKIRAKIS